MKGISISKNKLKIREMQQKMNNNSTMIVARGKRQFHEYDFEGSFSSSSSVSGVSSDLSLDSDSGEEITSLFSSSSSSSSSPGDFVVDPLSDMSSLIQKLPIKRGLSKFYQGKSQSFTSLASVGSLEDLSKPENPYKKKLKSCKSSREDLAELFCTRNAIPRTCSKKGLHSRGSCTSLNARRVGDNFMGNRPPIPTHISTTNIIMPNQSSLFA
ncbi:unnamed protein product [Lupinus luteus]|uniref:Oxidative stress 3 n=1 Tax=Lupinus luteus TaxID=3873 RepID=A0AAV1VWS5_LUPLU